MAFAFHYYFQYIVLFKNNHIGFKYAKMILCFGGNVILTAFHVFNKVFSGICIAY